ncbi:glycerol 3-phosphate dehydrogenase (quinone) subunit B [Cricetibacter osteomyelitidis]|uniref:Anaerobic glycerol-3-phosphate dehydrogenase subunit B n=1 Tax=Cricetibacter osteomyelitidis TaxID=1521931 RepID=A0A4R2T5Q9_9PAST|nr:glycerol-3-phosphate dehydrogenase subunit GlpB [Cricetibacter osteomyelitidis]TCP96901.1 glycerol 3-phosphate dehydrogenase (quinone) subunit B [Cricetibacter osteomyelitidis]
MNFDVIIIGGGLAGLTCGITLQESGKRCAIINNGQPALDFSSGSMDLLSCLPNGSKVRSFSQAFEALKTQLPQHPYAIIGEHTVSQKAKQFEQLIQSLNLELIGSSQENHQRVTALGGLRSTWLSPNSVPTVTSNEPFNHARIAVLGIEGYHDFQPQLLIENLKQNQQFAHCEFSTGFLNIPELDQLRQNAREFRSVNIAQLLEHKLSFRDLANEIKQAAGNASAVFLPACFGLDDQSFFNALQAVTKLALFELPTLPPSLLGIRQHRQLRQRFEELGGLMMNGDRALRAEFDGDNVRCIYTRLHQDEAIYATHFVLAAGSFFSNGLIAEFERIYEPVFGADIIHTALLNAEDRFSWTNKRFSSPQPYQSAGVIINAQCQVQKSGRFLANLYAAGNVIGGYNGIELGCGSGVAAVTALIAAEQIGGTE